MLFSMLLASFLSVYSLQGVNGYAIHESCNLDIIRAATDEALNIAEYAIFRAETNDPELVEELMQEFVGDRPRDKLRGISDLTLFS